MKTLTTISAWRGLERPAAPLEIPRLPGLWKWPGWRGLGKGLALLGLFALFARIGPLLRIADPTAAVVDVGALSLVLLAGVALAVFLAVAHWLVGLLWPVLGTYRRHYFSNNFKSLLPWQKVTFYLIVFFGLLYAFVCCLVAVF